MGGGQCAQGWAAGQHRGTRNTHRDNSQHSVSSGVAKQDVDKGDDLQGFAQAHAVGQDAAKATAGPVPLQ